MPIAIHTNSSAPATQSDVAARSGANPSRRPARRAATMTAATAMSESSIPIVVEPTSTCVLGW